MAFCALCAWPGSAWAGLWAYGSEYADRWPYSPDSFYSDYALIGGERDYDYKGPLVSDEEFERIYDERHDRFVGFGPDANATLTVDESLRADVEGTLGKTMRLNVGGYEERVLCYASSRPGDDTVALFTLSQCPGNCQRVSEIQVRARKREVRVLNKCARVPGAEVESVPGTPQHIQKGLPGTMWFHAARVSLAMSREEATRRGFPQLARVPGQDYPGNVGFDKYIVLWLREGRVSAWRVWLDWGL